MSDVFISYARSTEAHAQRIAEALRALGYGVWRDDELPAHRGYGDVIEERLAAAKAVVVVWSSEAVRSEWVRSEANRAREDRKLVQLSVDGARLPMPFDQIQCADLAGWAGETDAAAWRKVLASVEALVRPAGADANAGGQAARGRRSVSICVLPFANMSGDAEQAYFSDGISEDIITDLSKVSALAVVSRNSAFQFKGKHVDVRQVARQLEVSHVLEGSVRKAGNRVRITAQLIEGAGDSHVWAERYDRDLTDIFAVQDEISQAIVAALKLKLLPQEKTAITRRGTANADAYDLYLMARQIWINGGGDLRGHETIVRLCERAVELDPAYAQAWALMAMGHTTLHHRYGRPETGLAAAERALALDPDLAEPHAVMARHLAEVGREDEANAALEIALRLGPDSYEVHSAAGYMRFRQRRLRDAAAHYEKACALIQASFGPAAMLITCYGALGDTAARRRAATMALERTEAALAQDPRQGFALGYGAIALAALGERERAHEWVSRALLLDPDNHAMRYNLACSMSTDLRDITAAIDLLTPYFETASFAELAHAEVDPDLDPLRGDARYQAVIAKARARLEASRPPS
jgi:adenylate cyclase